MARFHIGVESALDPQTAQAMRELPDHYHVCVGFNVPRTTRMAEALVMRLAGDQSAMFMVGTLHLDAAVRGSAHGPWEIQTEEDGALYWDPYDTPLGDTNPLLGLQYTANKAQDWIAANLPALEDPLHPWHGDVRPQVFPRLLIISEEPVEVERHSWVWYFTETQQLIEHLEAWRPRDPFPITPAVMRHLVSQFELEPEEPWDDRPAEISVEALRDIQREWAALGEEIRDLRNLLSEATDALGAIRNRGRQIDEAIRHLTRGIESHPELIAHLNEMDRDEAEEPAPRKRAAKAIKVEVEAEPQEAEEEVEAKPARKTTRARKAVAAVEPPPTNDDDDEPEPPKRGRRKAVVEAAPEVAEPAAAAGPTRRRRSTATKDVLDAVPVEGAASSAGADAESADTPAAPHASTPAEQAAAEASGDLGYRFQPAPAVRKAAPTPAEQTPEEEDDEPVDFSAFAPSMSEFFRSPGGSLRRDQGGVGERPRFRGPLQQRPTGVTSGKEPMRLLPAAVRGLPHSPSARTADRIERAFRRTMPHFALGPFGYPNFEAFLLSAIEQGIIRGGGGTYWLPEEGALPPISETATASLVPGAKPGGFTEQAIISFLSLTAEQQRWLVQQMEQIEQRASFLTQRYLARGLTYGRPLFPLTEQEAEELVVAARKLHLLEEVEEPSDDRPRFTLKLNRAHPFVSAALRGGELPSLENNDHQPVGAL